MIELLAALATWRLASLVTHENGPWDVLAKIRHWAGVRYDEHSNCIGNELLCCFWCCSMWQALGVAFIVFLWRGDPFVVFLLDWLAFSTGAIIVESVVNHGTR